MRTVWLFAFLALIAVGPAADAALLFEASGITPEVYEIHATADFFYQSAYPNTPDPIVVSHNSPGRLLLQLWVDGSMVSYGDIYTSFNLSGGTVPANVSWSGTIYSSVRLEAYVEGDTTIWNSTRPDFPAIYYSTGQASVSGWTIDSTPELPEPSGLVALIAGLTGTVGALRLRRR